MFIIAHTGGAALEKGYSKTRPKTVADITKIVTIHYYEVGKDFAFENPQYFAIYLY